MSLWRNFNVPATKAPIPLGAFVRFCPMGSKAGPETPYQSARPNQPDRAPPLAEPGTPLNHLETNTFDSRGAPVSGVREGLSKDPAPCNIGMIRQPVSRPSY
jgi:hypothetical protein